MFLNQISTLPVEIPQDFHIYSHLKLNRISLSQLHHLHQLTLPVDIPPQYHKIKNQSKPLPLSSQKKIPQVLHHHYLLITKTSLGPILDPTYAPSVVPSAIPSSDSPHILLYLYPYILPRTSPSGTYLLPYSIKLLHIIVFLLFHLNSILYMHYAISFYCCECETNSLPQIQHG